MPTAVRPSAKLKPCPFIDRDDPRCGRRLSLSRLSEAFSYCLGEYRNCPVYRQLMREQYGERGRAQPITIQGRPVGAGRDARSAEVPV